MISDAYNVVGFRDIGEAAAFDVAVGAGAFTDQTITKTAGLIYPVLDDIVQVRYLSWAKLEKLIAKQQPKMKTAFPSDKPVKRINLKNVPKVHTAVDPRFL
jgi:hypothetical protein